MKTEELSAILQQIEQVLGQPSKCGECCGCTTTQALEQSSARFNELQAFAAAQSSRAFVQQQEAQFAQLLSQQQEHQKALRGINLE